MSLLLFMQPCLFEINCSVKTAMIACLAGFRDKCENCYVLWEDDVNGASDLIKKSMPTSINRSPDNRAFDAPNLQQLKDWIIDVCKEVPVGVSITELEEDMLDIMMSYIKEKP